MDNPYIKRQIVEVNYNKLLATRIIGLRKPFYYFVEENNLYLRLEPNEKIGLFVFNDSGKTTTFRAIINEILTDAGSITIL